MRLHEGRVPARGFAQPVDFRLQRHDLLTGLPERRNEALVVILLRSEFAPNLAQGCLDGEQTTLRAGLGHRILHPSHPRGAGS